MKVFLSWSGERSRAAAEAFREWLPYVINAVEPWVSSKDIDAGKRWGVDIQHQLEQTRFGIVFVTPENVVAPWLLFESGALAKTMEDTHVCTYLFGMTSSHLPAGPLTQFQAKTADRESTLELVKTINRALKNEAIPEARVAKAFTVWWPNLKKNLDEIPAETRDGNKLPDMSEMVAETLDVVRGLDRVFPKMVDTLISEFRRQQETQERHRNSLEHELKNERQVRLHLESMLRVFGAETHGTGTGTGDPDGDT